MVVNINQAAVRFHYICQNVNLLIIFYFLFSIFDLSRSLNTETNCLQRQNCRSACRPRQTVYFPAKQQLRRRHNLGNIMIGIFVVAALLCQQCVHVACNAEASTSGVIDGTEAVR